MPTPSELQEYVNDVAAELRADNKALLDENSRLKRELEGTGDDAYARGYNDGYEDGREDGGSHDS
jgi:flagellar biosynthesis/type III secretory pathway protein FliH